MFTTGQAALSKDLLHVYRRSGYFEERYLTASFNPIVLDSGKVGSSFTLIDDTTDRVIDERRLRTLRDLAARSMEAKEIDEACRIRATFATRCLWAGVDLRTVQQWLGHSDMESTMRYLKPSRSQQVRQKVQEIFA